ncbi:hypothetical protein H696_04706 [Fonticula alba]|uniref:Succinylglutamate desuccinylase/Aspartoacylase catalytic domain-containing protein n=1 Tax=Fonticula alba TaxID=691883 RepID=A0A058Z4H2_FONAL|nr:hypothetical protein H696_04706 [Fonticula alba]KCV68412.1 hypothetical protein H696_04706 [Fonticula alba]|eukprot:XP_009496844.1 hypothetical protein H696_04706 [Fonticula alba]
MPGSRPESRFSPAQYFDYRGLKEILAKFVDGAVGESAHHDDDVDDPAVAAADNYDSHDTVDKSKTPVVGASLATLRRADPATPASPGPAAAGTGTTTTGMVSAAGAAASAAVTNATTSPLPADKQNSPPSARSAFPANHSLQSKPLRVAVDQARRTSREDPYASSAPGTPGGTCSLFGASNAIPLSRATSNPHIMESLMGTALQLDDGVGRGSPAAPFKPFVLPPEKKEIADQLKEALRNEINKVSTVFDGYREEIKKKREQCEKELLQFEASLSPSLRGDNSASTDPLHSSSVASTESDGTASSSSHSSSGSMSLRNSSQHSFSALLAQTVDPLPDELVSKVTSLCDLADDLVAYALTNEQACTKFIKKCERRAPTAGVLASLARCVRSASFTSSIADIREVATWARKIAIDSRPSIEGMDPSPSHVFSECATTMVDPIESVPTFTTLDLNSLPSGRVSRMWIALATDGLGLPIRVPVMVAKGVKRGPVLGITAALHGNELNGIPLIHRLFREIDCTELSGCLVAVSIANPPGFLRQQRGYLDGSDLNRLMPGKPTGTAGQQYSYYLLERIVKKFDYLLDMHTASTGRVNSLYVRANMINPVTAKMAILQHPQIIVHNTGPDGSLRGAAHALGIHAITVEVGDPQRFHRRFIHFAHLGVENIMCHLKMVPRQSTRPEKDAVVCTRSFWMFTQSGGILTVLPEINDWVRAGDVVARVYNVFGDLIAQYIAPENGIVVGKSVNPVCSSGDRILHLGVTSEDGFESLTNDGHL